MTVVEALPENGSSGLPPFVAVIFALGSAIRHVTFAAILRDDQLHRRLRAAERGVGSARILRVVVRRDVEWHRHGRRIDPRDRLRDVLARGPANDSAAGSSRKIGGTL